MTELAHPERTTYAVARNVDGSVCHVLTVEPHLVCTTGLAVLETAELETDLLALIEPFSDALPPLPDVGEPVDGGTVYQHDGHAWFCRQTHDRTIYPPEDTPALFLRHRPETEGAVLEWMPGESVSVGMRRAHEGTTYIVLQAHTTQEGWEPDVMTTHWSVYEPPVGEGWVDTGETVTVLLGANVFGVTDTAPFAPGNLIRVGGALETTVTSIFTPGAPGVLAVDPHIAVTGGQSIEVWVP